MNSHLFQFLHGVKTDSAKRRGVSVLLFLLMPVFSPAIQAAALPQPGCQQYRHLTFGILPFVSNEQLVVTFSPLMGYLTQKLGVTVRMETAPNFTKFEKRTLQGRRYDILFTAPHFYPAAHDKAGYRLIAGVDSPGMWAVIVVPKKSQIYSVQDLRGKRLAIVDPTALATLLVKQYLRRAGINPETDLTLVTTPSHNASLLSSYHGVTDASALMQPPFAAASEQVRRNMRVIARTESTPHIPISVSARINQNCTRQLAQVRWQIYPWDDY